MKKIKRTVELLLLCAMAATIAIGCGKKEKDSDETVTAEVEEIATEKAELQRQEEESKPKVARADADRIEESDWEGSFEAEDTDNGEEQPEEDQVYVYIGTDKTGFTAYPVDVSSSVAGEELIEAIANLTGWDLSLAYEVTSGKGGVSVTFSRESTLVAGPPAEQKEEFFVYDWYQLAETILDSIQETLRQNYISAPGNPKDLDVWFSVEDENIVIEDKTIYVDEPYDDQDVF